MCYRLPINFGFEWIVRGKKEETPSFSKYLYNYNDVIDD